MTRSIFALIVLPLLAPLSAFAQYSSPEDAASHPCITVPYLSQWVAKRGGPCASDQSETVWAKICDGENLNGAAIQAPNNISHGQVCREVAAITPTPAPRIVRYFPTPETPAESLRKAFRSVWLFTKHNAVRVQTHAQLLCLLLASVVGVAIAIGYARRATRSAFTVNLYDKHEEEHSDKWS